MSFSLGKLAQVIHVTDDLAGARHLYGTVFGGECYYEGYSPYEKRDASIYAIGDLTMEPMSPSDDPGASELPVGRFLTRFGPRLHSIAINATGVLQLAEHLVAAGVRVVGPGGIPLTEVSTDPPVAIYTHPRDTHFLIELVDFGAPLMPASPRLADDWDPSKWERDHPLGIVGPSHVTALVTDVETAVGRLTALFDADVVADADRRAGDDGEARTARIRLGTETIIELHHPLDPTSVAGRSLAEQGEGLHGVTLVARDLDAAGAHLSTCGIRWTRTTAHDLRLDARDTAGANISFTDRTDPADV